MRQIEDVELKKLIQKGFDIELMAFEFDIPINHLINLKKELELSKLKEQSKENVDPNVIKIRKMREKYVKLVNNSKVVDNKNQTKFERKDIENCMISLNTNTKKITEALQKKEKVQYLNNALMDIRKISQYSLTVEQINAISDLFKSQEINDLNNKREFNPYIEKIRSIINITLNSKVSETEDIEELRKIRKMLIPTNSIANFANTKAKIDAKILRIQQKEIIGNIKTNVSPSIKELIMQIASGNIDCEDMRKQIEIESQNMLEENPKTKFRLTKEQHYNQIIMQINNCLTERAKQYPINNVNNTITLLQNIGNSVELAVNTVVRNLIERNEFIKAKQICETYSRNTGCGVPTYIRLLETEIQYAEIKNIALKMLICENSTKEDLENYNTILRSNVNMSKIIIGTNQNGEKVTLEDVWNNKEQKRYR